jgi:two-component system cell cycle sensor histidine kinase/response regulator CckA
VERKRVEDELRWKTAFLEAQVDSSPDAILVVDARNKSILKNQRLFDLFQIPPEIAADDDDARMLHYVTGRIKNPEQFLERVKHLYAHLDEIGRDEIELANGTVLDRYSSPVRDKTAKYYGRIWTFRDLTERRKLEDQFRQAQKMDGIGQLAGGIAHDFNNIMGIIMLQADILRSSSTHSPKTMELAAEIIGATERAAALTRQLLLFSRKEPMRLRDLDLNQSITNLTKMLGRAIGEHVIMQFQFAGQPLLIHADAGMLDQVLINLAVNARDAMPGGGRLLIKTEAVEFDESIRTQTINGRPGSFACLSVSDTGCGIPRENLQRIFEPFFTTKEVGKGTGLGLSTVFGIVRQHEGWVSVYSEVGCGTTFRLFFPRLARQEEPGSEQPAPDSIRGGNETILVVEDDVKLRTAVRQALSQLGYRVLEAADGVQALQVWKTHREDIRLLLTDLVMPGGINGRQLADQLWQERPALKVIFASGYSAEIADRNFPLEEGVNFLGKPYQARKLAQAIRQILDAKAG